MFGIFRDAVGSLFSSSESNPIINDIKEKLQNAWNNARKPDVERELDPYSQQYNAEKNTELGNLSMSTQSALEVELNSIEQKYRKLKNEAEQQIRDLENLKAKEQQRLRRERIIDENTPYNFLSRNYLNTSTDYTYYGRTPQQLENEKARAKQECRRKHESNEQYKKQRIINEYESKVNAKRNELKNKYNQQFEDQWSNQYKSVFVTQYNTFNPNDLKAKLLARHPWLSDELTSYASPDTLVDKFISMVIKRFFWECLLNNTAASWDKLDIRHHNTFNWADITTGQFNDLLNDIIQGYPLSDPEHFHDHQFSASIHSSILSPTFTRYDIYKLSLKYRKLNPIRCLREIYCADTIPMHIDEICTLSAEERRVIKNLFINIGSEEIPKWLLLHKPSHGNFILYKPAEFSIYGYDVDLNQLACFGRIDSVTLDLTQHLNINEERIPFSSVWHAALISRVFAGIQANVTDINEYRANLPALILVEQAFTDTFPSTYQNVTAKVLANRAPFSKYKADRLAASISGHDKIINFPVQDHYLEDWWDSRHDYPYFGAATVANFDSKQLDIKFNTSVFGNYVIKLGTIPSKITFTQAIKLSEHHNIRAIEVSYISESADITRSLKDEESTEYKLVTCNFKIVTILRQNTTRVENYQYLYHCAARNRFLQSFEPTFSGRAHNDMILRRKVWERVGQMITSFFKQAQLDHAKIDKIIEFNRNWRVADCQFEYKPTNDTNKQIWNFAQITQMGSDGLKYFFKRLQAVYVNSWDSTYKETAPQLACVFDLNGSIAESPNLYIRNLVNHIKSFGKIRDSRNYTRQTSCSPLFKSLGLILPQNIDASIINSIVCLFEELNDRRKVYPDEVCHVNLYNLDIRNATHFKLIEDLLDLANSPDDQLLIAPIIIAWDREAFRNEPELASRKVKYKQLQNIVANNQRLTRVTELAENTEALNLTIDRMFNPDMVLEQRLEQEAQVWEGDDIEYPLTSQATGDKPQTQQQQQLQQQQQQQQKLQQQQQQETSEEVELERQVHRYHGDEGLLINRHNIEAKGREYWESNCKDVHNNSGIAEDSDLSELFSLWVGSDKDGTFVINRIEPLAMRKLMEFAPCFRYGIDWERTPGFGVSQSRIDNAYILTYDARLEKQELMEQAENIAQDKRDPFARQLKKKKLAKEFIGDYRQFVAYSTSSLPITADNQQSLWTDMSTEDTDAMRLENMRYNAESLSALNHTSPEANSAIVARYNSDTVVYVPEEISESLNNLKNWARQFVTNEEFLENLFNDFNHQHLQALGQLFNHYDCKTQLDFNYNGSYQWLKLAEQIYNSFQLEHFQIWKNRILAPRDDWSEIFESEEILTTMRCVASLHSPALQNVFWQLVDLHGEAVGPMRLTEVWYGFSKIAKYCERKYLTINHDSCIDYIESIKDGNFNATNFLYRLNYVLNFVSGKSDSRNIQQDILNNLEKIDWRHNGLYYACRYGKFRYWDAEMQLTSLKTLTADENDTLYNVRWDRIDPNSITDVQSYALRYAASRIELSFHDFTKLKDILYNNSINSLVNAIDGDNFSLNMRLIIACLAVGVDKVDTLEKPEVVASLKDLKAPKYSGYLNHLADIIKLDSNLTKYSLQIRLHDIPVLLDTMYENSIVMGELRGMGIDLDLDFLNTCGYALHCFASHGLPKDLQKDNLNKLLVAIANREVLITDPIVNTYPWVIISLPDDFNSEDIVADKLKDSTTFTNIQVLLRQIRSVNPAITTYYPNLDELNTVADRITSSDNLERERRQVVREWISRGFKITDQDARFRMLDEIEVDTIINTPNLTLSDAHEDLNKALFNRLVPLLAVRINQDFEDQFAPLLDILQKLDCKKYYNELGQVLGLLIKKAQNTEGEVERYYSLPQLVDWLNVFLDEKTFEQRPYPTEFLKSLLDDAISNEESSLLNADFTYLDENDDATLELKHDISFSTDSRLTYNAQKLLVNLAIKLKNTYYVDKGATLEAIRNHLLNINGDKREAFYIKYVEKKAVKGTLTPVTLDVLGRLSKNLEYISNEIFQGLLKNNQINILEKLFYEQITIINANKYLGFDSSSKSEYIKLILLADLPHLDNLDSINSELYHWDEAEISYLAEYYKSLPRPNPEQLLNLATRFSTADDLICEFESVEQAKDKHGHDKRYYSLNTDDLDNIKRVLSGIKLKGKGFISDNEQKQLLNLLYYTNTFSQTNKLQKQTPKTLIENLYQELNNLKCLRDPKEIAQSKSRVLAYMREVLLRKTGKWANHTQMIDLLFGALHNDTSILHQLKTGQGKSIITLMRNAYRALNGQIVDIYSSKDSLSKRDHEEFAMVFDAFGIKNSHLTESSDPSLYNTTVNENGVGAVNYITIGNWSLFTSGVFWQARGRFDLKAKNRVVFIDEGDHVLLDENTQFNFSDNGDNQTIYNYDEWVYREAYEFYRAYRKTFKGIFENSPVISRNNEIRNLCIRLQQSERFKAPVESRFFKEYILPTIQEPNPENFEARDQQLRQLFAAAYVAENLKEKTDYCIMPEIREISEGVGIDTRFAKVVINNIVYHGSTYSDLVQQFLHVRLNLQAVENGQTPNFFVEPNSEIALSLNAPYVIKNFYAHKEACTGTGGNHEQLEVFNQEFDIDCVIKVPTHEPIRTEFLPPIYVGEPDLDDVTEIDSIDHTDIRHTTHVQARQITQQILDNPNNPVLITCEDDNAVELLGGLIADILSRENGIELDTDLHDLGLERKAKFIIDTNSSGNPESKVLPFCGRQGSITISSRMGRGTDIRPYDADVGLFVIRTYPTDPRVEKQERGRQGRNGAAGKCIDIIDYARVANEIKKIKDLPGYRELWTTEMANAQEHLAQKLRKHEDRLSKGGQKHKKWNEIFENEDLKTKYLNTRVLQKLKQIKKAEATKYNRRKEFVQAILSGHVIETLPELGTDFDTFKAEWKKARRKFDAAWNRRLANKTSGDTEAVFNEYLIAVNNVWQGLSAEFPQLNPYLLIGMFNEEELPEESVGTSSSFEVDRREFNKINSRWEGFDVESSITANQKETLIADKKVLKVLNRKYQPNIRDRSARLLALGIEESDAENLSREINSIYSRISTLAQREPTAVEEQIQTHSLSSSRTNHHCSTPTQRRDMPEVIGFYQIWLQTAAKHLISPEKAVEKEVAEAILGSAEYSYVDIFFSDLESLSCHDPRFTFNASDESSDDEFFDCADGAYGFESKESEDYVSADVQTSIRKSLFANLQDIFRDHPNSHIIPLYEWSEVIKSLAYSNDEKILTNYTNWFKEFFEALEPFAESPSEVKSAEDVIKINKLFTLAKHIFFNAYEESSSIEFTKNYISILMGDYKDDFDKYYAYLEQVFANEDIDLEKTSRILQKHTNRADLFRLLDICDSIEESEVLDTRLAKFNEFAADAENYALDENPANIRPIFELVAYSGQEVIPTLADFQEESIEQSTELLEVLRYRPGYTQEEYKNFMGIFNSPERLEMLKTLPPYLSLNYLYTNLRDVPGLHDKGQMRRKFALIESSFSNFVEFLTKRNIIIGNSEYINPVDQESYTMWMNAFETFDQTKFNVFINIAGDYLNIADSTLHSIATMYKNNVIENTDTLKKTLDVINAIYNLSTELHTGLLGDFSSIDSDEKLDKYLNKTSDLTTLIAKYPDISAETLRLIIQLLVKTDYAIIDSLDELLTIYKDQGHKEDLVDCDSYLKDLLVQDVEDINPLLQGNIKVLNLLTEYEIKYNSTYPRELYTDRCLNNDYITTMQDLLYGIQNSAKVANEETRNLFINKYLEYSINDVNLTNLFKLANQYTTLSSREIAIILDKFQSHKEKYAEAFRMFTKANSLSGEDNENELDKLFSRFGQMQESRILLMRYVKHGLLDHVESGNFKASCCKKQEALYKSAALPMVNSSSDHGVFAKTLKSWLNKISNIMREIYEIMRSPASPEAVETAELNKTEISSIFNKNKNYYNSCWFKSSTRKGQASQFFKDLEKNIEETNIEKMFIDTFNTIIRAQGGILYNDRVNNQKRWFTNINKKGYSRLFDVTNDILREFLQKYMLNLSQNKINLSTHTKFLVDMRDHLKTNIISLKHSLPKGNPLYEALNNINLTSMVDIDLGLAVKDAFSDNKGLVPKHLTHIAENILLLADICERNTACTDERSMNQSLAF